MGLVRALFILYSWTVLTGAPRLQQQSGRPRQSREVGRAELHWREEYLRTMGWTENASSDWPAYLHTGDRSKVGIQQGW